MSAPDEIRQLADRLDQHLPPYVILDPGTTRAAAVALRDHANLLAELALYELDYKCSEMDCVCLAADELVGALRAIVAAVSPPPAPTTCPNCGSDKPNMCASDADAPPHGWSDDGACCSDSWHQAAT